jgi:hypothetical protein
MKKVTLELACQLTGEEIQDKGRAIAGYMVQYDESEALKKAQAKEAADELKALRTKMSDLAQVIKAGAELRPVECEVRFNVPTVGTKRIVRKDTNELVRDEAMSPDEQQNNLFDDVNELDRMFGSGPEVPPEDQPPAP